MRLNGNTLAKNSAQRAAILESRLMTLLCSRLNYRMISVCWLRHVARSVQGTSSRPRFDLRLIPSLSSTMCSAGAS
jgi:hypothetical protein